MTWQAQGLPADVEEEILDALRDRRVTGFAIDPNRRTVSMVWSSGPGSSGRTGIPLEELLGAVLRRAARSEPEASR